MENLLLSGYTVLPSWRKHASDVPHLDEKLICSPVNCPFMAASYSSPNSAGPMRTDANVGKKAHYTPNSMPDYPKLRGDREAPMLVANNVMSREVPTFRHDGKDSEYTQVKPL